MLQYILFGQGMPLASANGFGYGRSSARCAPMKDLKTCLQISVCAEEDEPAKGNPLWIR